MNISRWARGSATGGNAGRRLRSASTLFFRVLLVSTEASILVGGGVRTIKCKLNMYITHVIQPHHLNLNNAEGIGGANHYVLPFD